MEEPDKIHCEGVGEGWSMTMISESKSVAHEYKKRYCHGDWTQCKIARGLWAKYDDIGDLRMMCRAKPFQVRGEKAL